jgi:biopolymer transport protein ExbD
MAKLTPQEQEAKEAAWMMKQERKGRRLRRKAREAAGEIKELNITAMMDMMTILLVFLLKSYSASTLTVAMNDELMPPSSSTRLDPTEATTVTITQKDVAVMDRAVVPIVNGTIPDEYKEGKSREAMLIPGLKTAFVKEVDKAKKIAGWNKAAQFEGMLLVVSDSRIPYRSLMEVLYTAGQAELGQYKFLVLKNE